MIRYIVTSVLLASVLRPPTAFSQDENCEKGVTLKGPAELCLEGRWCRKGNWLNEYGRPLNLEGTKYAGASHVKLKPEGYQGFKVVKRCAVNGFERLDTIYGENSEITFVDMDAFSRLPNLRSIYLAFNLLNSLEYGVFNNLPVEFLDLSWNEIEFISAGCFDEMENLKHLNLSHNLLKEFDISNANILLDELILSHNFLPSIDLAKNNDFDVLDLSFNDLTSINLHYGLRHGKVDLTNNKLNDIKWGGGIIDDLRLPLNNLTDMAPLLGPEKKLGRVTLYPNPWNCDNLQSYLNNLNKNDVTVVAPYGDKRLNFRKVSDPTCAAPTLSGYETYQRVRDSFVMMPKTCDSDRGCPLSMVCRTGQCIDPCNYDPCRGDKVCECRKHKAVCRCPGRKTTDSLRLFSKCYDYDSVPKLKQRESFTVDCLDACGTKSKGFSLLAFAVKDKLLFIACCWISLSFIMWK